MCRVINKILKSLSYTHCTATINSTSPPPPSGAVFLQEVCLLYVCVCVCVSLLPGFLGTNSCDSLDDGSTSISSQSVKRANAVSVFAPVL